MKDPRWLHDALFNFAFAAGLWSAQIGAVVVGGELLIRLLKAKEKREMVANG